MLPRIFPIFFLLILSSFQFAIGQPDTESMDDQASPDRPGGAYCNVFYVTSYETEALPFKDVCFVVDEYSMGNAKYFRCIGPIEGTIDLFRSYPWSIQFNLPYVAEGERLAVKMPEQLDLGSVEMSPGDFFLTVSDNRDPERARQAKKRFDFASVSGKATITDYHPMEGDMKFPEYTAQIDVWLKHVVYEGDKPMVEGNPVRLKMVLKVEALD